MQAQLLWGQHKVLFGGLLCRPSGPSGRLTWQFHFGMEVRFGRNEGISTFGLGLGFVRVKRDIGPTAGDQRKVLFGGLMC